MTVGILGYQGCIEPHEVIFAQLSVPTRRVLTAEDLSHVDRLIIPGGESTTMLRLIEGSGIGPALQAFAGGRPVWGICAGAIIAAQSVVNPSQRSLNLIDITAHRNYYGPQTESFTEDLQVVIPNLTPAPLNVSASFIRAPRLDSAPQSPGRSPLMVAARSNDQPVFFTQGRVWSCSFHVELGSDTALHQLFASL